MPIARHARRFASILPLAALRGLPALLVLAALPAAFPARAQAPTWDVAYSLTNRHQAFEVAFLPFLAEEHYQGFFTGVRAGAAFVVDREGEREQGLRLHLDLTGSRGRFYGHAGPFLSAGQGLGVGLGLRAAAGWRFTPVFRAGVVGDAVACTRGTRGSLGVQAGFTF